jgi:hypothetical protein
MHVDTWERTPVPQLAEQPTACTVVHSNDAVTLTCTAAELPVTTAAVPGYTPEYRSSAPTRKLAAGMLDDCDGTFHTTWFSPLTIADNSPSTTPVGASLSSISVARDRPASLEKPSAVKLNTHGWPV